MSKAKEFLGIVKEKMGSDLDLALDTVENASYKDLAGCARLIGIQDDMLADLTDIESLTDRKLALSGIIATHICHNYNVPQEQITGFVYGIRAVMETQRAMNKS